MVLYLSQLTKTLLSLLLNCIIFIGPERKMNKISINPILFIKLITLG